jgi:hypothetical protein
MIRRHRLWRRRRKRVFGGIWVRTLGPVVLRGSLRRAVNPGQFLRADGDSVASHVDLWGNFAKKLLVVPQQVEQLGLDLNGVLVPSIGERLPTGLDSQDGHGGQDENWIHGARFLANGDIRDPKFMSCRKNRRPTRR